MPAKSTQPPTRQPRSIAASVQMTTDEYDQVRLLAAADGRSISSYLHRLVAQHLENERSRC